MKNLLSDMIEDNIQFTTNEIPSLPLIAISSTMVHQHTGYENTIILNNARREDITKDTNTYDTEPFLLVKFW